MQEMQEVPMQETQEAPMQETPMQEVQETLRHHQAGEAHIGDVGDGGDPEEVFHRVFHHAVQVYRNHRGVLV